MDIILAAFFCLYVVPCVLAVVVVHLNSEKNRESRVRSATVREPPPIAPIAAKETPEVVRVEPSPAVAQVHHGPVQEFSGVTGEVLSAYAEGLRVLQAKANVKIPAQATLRESLKSLSSLPSPATDAFRELTRLAEVALYSPDQVTEDMAAKARRLAAEIERGAPSS